MGWPHYQIVTYVTRRLSITDVTTIGTGQLAALVGRINRLHNALAPRPAAEVSLITPGTLPCLSNYMTKEPIKTIGLRDA